MRTMPFRVTPETAMRALWLTWWLSWWAAALWSDRSVKRPGTRHQITYRALAGVGAILLFGAYQHPIDAEVRLWRTADPLAWTMLPFIGAGLLFTWWARIHLGRLWSV